MSRGFCTAHQIYSCTICQESLMHEMERGYNSRSSRHYRTTTDNGFYSEEHHGDGTWTITRKGEVPIRYCSCGDEPFACHVYMDKKCLHAYVPRVTPMTPMSSAGPYGGNYEQPQIENLCTDCGTNYWPHERGTPNYPCDPEKIKRELELAKERAAKLAQQELDRIYLDTYPGSNYTLSGLCQWQAWRNEWIRTGQTYALDRMKMYDVPAPEKPKQVEVVKPFPTKKYALIALSVVVVFWILLGVMMGLGL